LNPIRRDQHFSQSSQHMEPVWDQERGEQMY
jgi:hypothetical protein